MLYKETELTAKFLYKKVLTALNKWGEVNEMPKTLLEGLLLTRQKRQKTHGVTTNVQARAATNDVILDAHSRLKQVNNIAAEIIQARFMDGKSIASLAEQKNHSQEWVNQMQRKGVKILTEILIDQEKKLRQIYLEQNRSLLPLPYNQKLFGLEKLTEEICEFLSDQASPPLSAIVGIGGIGKTTLCGQVVLQLAATFQFEQICWYTVQNSSRYDHRRTPEILFDQLLSYLANNLGLISVRNSNDIESTHYLLKRLFHELPHLIIIDNLEAPDEVDFLLPKLHSLGNPTKFILTTRTIPHGVMHIPVFAVTQLSYSEATQLLHHSQSMMRSENVIFSTEDIEAIYSVVGGNPLALRLVASLIRYLPLRQVLSDLQAGDSISTDQLYRNIYWQAWRSLNEASKIILLSLTTVGERGIAADLLYPITKLPLGEYWSALAQLGSYSLVDVKKLSANDQHLQIHPLTASFLLNDVIQWKTNGS